MPNKPKHRYTVEDLSFLAGQEKLPEVHGIRKFLTLVFAGPARSRSFVEQIGMNLMPTAGSDEENIRVGFDVIGKLFDGIPVGVNDTATRVIREMTKRCHEKGIVSIALHVARSRYEIYEEVKAKLLELGIKIEPPQTLQQQRAQAASQPGVRRPARQPKANPKKQQKRIPGIKP